MRTTVVMMVLALAKTVAAAQTSTETIRKELAFEKKISQNTVIIANINGDIHVTGYDGDNVIVEVEKKITAKTPERLQEGKDKIQLGIMDRADTLVLYVSGSIGTFCGDHAFKNCHGDPWGYQWICRDGRNCHESFDYKLNFNVKVPKNIQLHLGTINDGDVTVENMNGAVTATNVNGSVRLTNLTQRAVVKTINGDVDVDYDHNPSGDCRFYTLNGTINANFQKGLDASLSFQSFNGAFFTNVDLESLPPQLEKNSSDKGLKYMVHGNRYRTGKQGAVKLDFETLNGNVYVREKLN